MTLPLWVEEYRDRTFSRGAEGPDAFDCYGLVRAVLRDQWSLETPALDARWHSDADGALRSATSAGGGPWSLVKSAPEPSDVLAFVLPGQAELHVGVVVAPGWMLHARLDHGVRTERYDRPPWSIFCGGVFRHREMVRP